MNIRFFRNIENDEIYSIDTVLRDFEQFREEDPETYDGVNFGQYLNDCLGKNGSLEEVYLHRLIRSGAIWKTCKGDITAAFSDEDGNYLEDCKTGKRYFVFDRVLDDEVMVYEKVRG